MKALEGVKILDFTRVQSGPIWKSVTIPVLRRIAPLRYVLGRARDMRPN